MNKFFSAILALVVLAAALPVHAGEVSSTVKVFSNLSTNSGSAQYSAASDVSNYRHKTVIVQGIAVAAHAATTLSGTFLVQCAPTSTGPWQTCVGPTGSAMSTTSNGVLYFTGANPFVRFSWTKTAGEVSAYLSVGN